MSENRVLFFEKSEVIFTKWCFIFVLFFDKSDYDHCSGCLSRGCLPRGVVCGRHPFPVNRITDTCRNITLAQLRCGWQKGHWRWLLRFYVFCPPPAPLDQLLLSGCVCVCVCVCVWRLYQGHFQGHHLVPLILFPDKNDNASLIRKFYYNGHRSYCQ